jgi:hypothetical protein
MHQFTYIICLFYLSISRRYKRKPIDIDVNRDNFLETKEGTSEYRRDKAFELKMKIDLTEQKSEVGMES